MLSFEDVRSQADRQKGPLLPPWSGNSPIVRRYSERMSKTICSERPNAIKLTLIQSSGGGSGGGSGRSGGGGGGAGGAHANGNHHHHGHHHAAAGGAGPGAGGVNENKSVDFLYYSDSDSDADEDGDVGIANSLAYRVSVNFTDCLGRTEITSWNFLGLKISLLEKHSLFLHRKSHA